MPKWNKALSQSAALKKGGPFKPDIVPTIKKYDQLEADFEKLVKEQTKLPEILQQLKPKFAALNPKLDKLNEQMKKVKEEDGTKFGEIGGRLSNYAEDPDAKNSDVQKALDDLMDTQVDAATMIRSLSDQIVKVNDEYTPVIKKVRDEYKSKSANLKSRWEKCQADCKSTRGQIRSIALSYEKIATKMNDTDTVKALRTFVSELG